MSLSLSRPAVELATIKYHRWIELVTTLLSWSLPLSASVLMSVLSSVCVFVGTSQKRQDPKQARREPDLSGYTMYTCSRTSTESIDR
jgi:uncharacterized membrane protein